MEVNIVSESNNENIIKIDFNGLFKIDGGVDSINPYWEVDKETYIKIMGEKYLEFADKTEKGKYKLYLLKLINSNNENKKQHILIKIENK
jgi:hypothetical protein